MRLTREQWEVKAEAFHKQRPEVYAYLVALARRARLRDRNRKVGIELLINMARWEFNFEHVDGEQFKICQNYARYYAKLIMAQEPDLANIFKLKALYKNGLAED